MYINPKYRKLVKGYKPDTINSLKTLLEDTESYLKQLESFLHNAHEVSSDMWKIAEWPHPLIKILKKALEDELEIADS